MLRLGGPEPHGRRSGVVHILTESEEEALDRARAVATLLGAQGSLDVDAVEDRRPRRRCCRSPRSAPTTCTRSSRRSSTRAPPRSCTPAVGAQHRHGARPLRRPHRRRDRQQPAAARRLPGLAVGGEGVPVRADVRRVRRAARSSLVDVPGYLPGVGQEWDGVVRRGAKLLHAFGECVVPRVTLVTRKTYGGAYIAMNARALGATRVFAWPGAEVAVMGAGRRDPDPAPAQARRGRPRPAPAGGGRAGRRARAASPAASTRPWRSASSTRSSSRGHPLGDRAGHRHGGRLVGVRAGRTATSRC